MSVSQYLAFDLQNFKMYSKQLIVKCSFFEIDKLIKSIWNPQDLRFTLHDVATPGVEPVPQPTNPGVEPGQRFHNIRRFSSWLIWQRSATWDKGFWESIKKVNIFYNLQNLQIMNIRKHE